MADRIDLNLGRLKDWARRRVAEKLLQAGPTLVAYAQASTPVDTGFLRDSEGFVVVQSTLTLQLYADASYAVYQERQKGFLRAAALQLPRLLGLVGNVEVAFPNAPAEFAGFTSDTARPGKARRVTLKVGRSVNRNPRRPRR